MLEAKKTIWVEKIFSIYNRNLIRRRFHSLNILDIELLSSRNKEIPTIIFANHSSWWDGLIIFQIIQNTNMDFFVMMEEKQLNKLPLFRRLGAFSVVRDNPRSAVGSINYSVKLLKNNPDRMLLVFPQGEILPNNLRPIVFYNGISRIIEKVENCQIFNLALCYEFLGDYKPSIFVKIKNSEIPNKLKSKDQTREFETEMNSNLDELKQLVIKNDTGKFVNII